MRSGPANTLDSGDSGTRVEVAAIVGGVVSSLIAAAILGCSHWLRSRHRPVPFRVIMRDVRALAEKIKADQTFRPEAVVAVSRSGAIVGGMLVGLLNGLAIEAPIVMAIKLYRDHPGGVRRTDITYGPTDLARFGRIIL